MPILSRPSIMRLALAMFMTTLLTSCGGETTSASHDDGSSELTIAIDDDGSSKLTIAIDNSFDDETWQPPPWEQFTVKLAPVTWTDQVTAVGDVGDRNALLGDSCDQLLADHPEVNSCEEHSTRRAETGTYTEVGKLSADGTMTIVSPDRASALTIQAPHPTDDHCGWFGYEEIEPGQIEVVVALGLSCA